MSIDRIQLSQQAEKRLLKLKRSTGIKHWSVLCRWAFCTSLAEPSAPPAAEILADGKVETSFEVFGGAQRELYLALLEARCRRDGLGVDEETLAAQLRLHVHRGIGYLSAARRVERVEDLFRRLLPVRKP
jgi:DNA sulfur modification protein DndE